MEQLKKIISNIPHEIKIIRPLKKGLARITLGTLHKYGKETPIYIIPLGIDYENHFNMNSDILLNVGNPIDVSKYYDQFNILHRKPLFSLIHLTKISEYKHHQCE